MNGALLRQIYRKHLSAPLGVFRPGKAGHDIRHAKNVVFKDVPPSVSPEDARENIVIEDVTGFETEGLKAPFFSESTSE